MEIQSLSVVVPTHNKCVNSCAFCVSRTHTNHYEDKINKVAKAYCDGDEKYKDSREYLDYFNRLQFARDNGCNVVVLTGTGEPVQNPHFLDFFSEINKTLFTPFKSIEIQTTGVLLNEKMLAHLREVGFTTLSFSLSNIFDNNRNLEIIGCDPKLAFNVFETIKLVRKYDFNLRLSLNLVNDYDIIPVDRVIERCKELGADQVTFRKLYKSELNNEIDRWIEANASKDFYNRLVRQVQEEGRFLGYLPFGPKIFDIDEMSVCIDDDCMSQEIKNTYKYLIIRENCKLYFRWETRGSLIF
jgi:uncharacterized Fe-S cluster-containing radical SAM superfamily enzyme